MAIGVQKNSTVLAIETEVTEGTYVAPAAATSYLAVLSDGFDFTPSKELLERDVLTSSIGKVTPRVGLRSAAQTIPVEMKGSGTEGSAPEYDLLVKGLLGNVRTVSSRTTTGTTHTTTVINATAHSYNIGDIIVILESGSHSVHAITATATNSFTYSPARSVAPSDAVQIAKVKTFYPANSGHPSLSTSLYWGNEILQKGIGMKVASMSLDNFTTGQLASFNFSLEGLDFDETNTASPYTPTLDDETPPIILDACMFQDGTEIKINEFGLNVENTLSFIANTCDGRYSSRVTERVVTGTVNPFKDDTSVANFTKFSANTEFSLFVAAYNPSTVTGEIDLGSVVGFYLPKCITTEYAVSDIDGILIDQISFQASRGSTGATEEIYIGFI